MVEKIEYPRFFLGANTPNGFVSRFDELADFSSDWRLFVIKAGPGTGKSTLMKKLAECIRTKCENIEMIHCSSDVNSLDGIIFHDLKIAIADGTLPHAIEPRFPGAFEQIVYLGDCWSSEFLYENKEEIKRLVLNNSAIHESACRYLKTANYIANDTYKIAEKSINYSKLDKIINKVAGRELRFKTGKKATEKVRILSAITNEGFTIFDDTAKKLAKKIYVIKDKYSAISHHFLSGIREKALENGYAIVTCYCPFSSLEKIEHLFIPALSLGFMTSNANHTLECIAPYKIINSGRFIDNEELMKNKKRLHFNTKATKLMLEQSQRCMFLAKENHDCIEDYYTNSMNYDKLNKKTDDLIEFIQTII